MAWCHHPFTSHIPTAGRLNFNKPHELHNISFIMNKHIILFLLLSIALTIMAVPVTTPKTPAKKVMSLFFYFCWLPPNIIVLRGNADDPHHECPTPHLRRVLRPAGPILFPAGTVPGFVKWIYVAIPPICASTTQGISKMVQGNSVGLSGT